jgi:hypothetical protein
VRFHSFTVKKARSSLGGAVCWIRESSGWKQGEERTYLGWGWGIINLANSRAVKRDVCLSFDCAPAEGKFLQRVKGCGNSAEAEGTAIGRGFAILSPMGVFHRSAAQRSAHPKMRGLCCMKASTHIPLIVLIRYSF